jgi:AraC-like DNA-binding protein
MGSGPHSFAALVGEGQRAGRTTVPAVQIARRMRFRRPLPEVLPGLFSGEYEGGRIPLHTYEALLVVLPVTRFVVLAGCAAVYTRPGDIWLSNMLDLHGATAVAMPCRARILVVPSELLQEVAHPVPRFASGPLGDPALAHALSELWEDLELPAEPTRVAEDFRALLRELVQRHSGADGPPSAANRMEVATQRALEHLQHRIPEPQALEEVAAVVRVSKSYLVREFHRMVGLPPHAYHVQLRVARAARLLAMGVSLSRVAVEAGFADQSHLSRRFKAAYGLTPRGFARSVRAAPMAFGGLREEVA